MEYLNIHRSTVEGEPMQDAPPAAVRTWLFLLTYCAGQENSGRIAGAKGWHDRKWLKQCGLSKDDVEVVPTGLWRWDGEDLVLEFYPLDQEAKFKSNRRIGASGGRKSGEVRRAKKGHGSSEREADGSSEREADGSSEREADGSSEREATVERKGKERKEKEGKVREGAPSDSDILIPTEAEVREWAEVADVDPEFAAQKHASFSERHAWMANGELIDWQGRLKRFWKDDQAEWEDRQKKKAGQKNGGGAGTTWKSSLPGGKPAGWRDGDEGWWWSEELELIEKALHGALLGGQEEQAGRLKEVLKERKQ